jgi:hypothetical protein
VKYLVLKQMAPRTTPRACCCAWASRSPSKCTPRRSSSTRSSPSRSALPAEVPAAARGGAAVGTDLPLRLRECGHESVRGSSGVRTRHLRKFGDLPGPPRRVPGYLGRRPPHPAGKVSSLTGGIFVRRRAGACSGARRSRSEFLADRYRSGAIQRSRHRRQTKVLLPRCVTITDDIHLYTDRARKAPRRQRRNSADRAGKGRLSHPNETGRAANRAAFTWATFEGTGRACFVV